MGSALQRRQQWKNAWFAAALAGALLSSPLYARAETVHVVAKGHTLGKISKRYNVSIELIREVNGLAKGDVIKPGQKLVIPEKHEVAAAKAHGAALKQAREKAKELRQYQRKPKQPGLVRFDGKNGKASVRIRNSNGSFRSESLNELRDILAHRDQSKHAVDRQLAEKIAEISDFFGGRTLSIVSGYRPSTSNQYTAHSRHAVGKALDFRVVGVPNPVVFELCKTIDKSGCGIYPKSGFIHVDSRPQMYAWIDHSGPGESPRYERVSVPGSATPPISFAKLDNQTGNQHATVIKGEATKKGGQTDPISPKEGNKSKNLENEDRTDNRKKTPGKKLPD